MLSAEKLLEYKNKPPPRVYSLGAKESEGSNTEFDASQLDAKLHNMEELLAMERVRMMGLLSKAVWCPEKKKAEVLSKVGSHWDVMGHSEKSKTYLYPEEALYLIDIGALEVTYNGVPLSLQRAFNLFANTENLFAKYRVYSQLSLLGYKVMRHSTKNVLTKYEKDINVHKIATKHKDLAEGRSKKDNLAIQGSVQSGASNLFLEAFPIQINDDDSKVLILEKLQRVGPKKLTLDPPANVSIDFDVFLPGTETAPFRKTTVQSPAMRVKVLLSSEKAPNIVDICREERYFQDSVALLHAVVYPDSISFLQIAAIDLPDIT